MVLLGGPRSQGPGQRREGRWGHRESVSAGKEVRSGEKKALAKVVVLVTARRRSLLSRALTDEWGFNGTLYALSLLPQWSL